MFLSASFDKLDSKVFLKAIINIFIKNFRIKWMWYVKKSLIINYLGLSQLGASSVWVSRGWGGLRFSSGIGIPTENKFMNEK